MGFFCIRSFEPSSYAWLSLVVVDDRVNSLVVSDCVHPVFLSNSRFFPSLAFFRLQSGSILYVPYYQSVSFTIPLILPTFNICLFISLTRLTLYYSTYPTCTQY